MIDPNVWVSAVINPYGTPARVAEAVARNVITAVVSQQLVDELAAVLIRPKFRKWISTGDAVAFVDSLGAHADLRDSPEPSMTPIRDPNDAYPVALAEATGSLLVKRRRRPPPWTLGSAGNQPSSATGSSRRRRPGA